MVKMVRTFPEIFIFNLQFFNSFDVVDISRTTSCLEEKMNDIIHEHGKGNNTTFYRSFSRPFRNDIALLKLSDMCMCRILGFC
jgi:hypothetical protein